MARGRGSSPQMRKIIAELRAMDDVRFSTELRKELAKAARPFVPVVRAAILNTPTHGMKHTGLRVRITKCVITWSKLESHNVAVGITVDGSRMRTGEKSLPLMLDGRKAWRHPVFGNRDNWVAQASHPYFDEATSMWGPASRRAIDRALDNVSAKISGSATRSAG